MRNEKTNQVVFSPGKSTALMNQIHDDDLLTLALERLKNYDPAKVISGDEVWASLSLTKEELDAVGDVEFE